MLRNFGQAQEMVSAFKETLNSAVDEVEADQFVFERLDRIFRKVGDFHKQISFEIQGLCTEEQAKLSKFNREKSSASLQNMSVFLGEMQKLGNSYFQLSECSGTARRFLQDSKKEREDTNKVIENERKHVCQALEKIALRMDKCRGKAHRKAEKLGNNMDLKQINRRRFSSGDFVPGPKKPSTKSGATRTLKNIAASKKLIAEHSDDLSECNHAFVGIREDRGKPLFKLISSKISSRKMLMNECMGSFEEGMSTLAQATSIMTLNVKKLKLVDKDLDISTGRIDKICKILEMGENEVFLDDLPFTDEDMNITKKAFSFKMKQSKATLDLKLEENEEHSDEEDSDVGEDLVFDNTFENLLQLEKEKLSSFSEECVLAQLLLKRLVEVNGQNTEGIFRVSPNFQALKNLEDQINRFDFDFSKIDDPYLIAEIFKRWLVQMSVPFIPDEFYEQCKEIGNEYQKASELNDTTRFSAEKLFKKLSRPKQLLFQRIAGICHLISSGECQENTRMDIKNLAIVFSQSFIRYDGKDISEAIKSIGIENGFSECFLKFLIDSGYTTDPVAQ